MSVEEEFDHKRFFDFEKKNNLFELKMGNFFLWDIIRSQVYLELLWNYTSLSGVKSKKSLRYIFKTVLELIRFFYYILFTRSDYIFFANSRNRISEKFDDQNLRSIYNEIRGEKLEIESFQQEKEYRLNSRSVFSANPIIRKFFRFFVKRKMPSEIFTLICKEFPSFSLQQELLQNIISDFLIDRVFYKILFKIQKPKAIFVTQNGIQKGLFAAAKFCNIPVFEVQHGIIDEGHVVYNYSKDLNYNEGSIYLPSHFLTFSPFWTTNLYLPTVKVIPIGNDSFYSAGGLNISDVRNNRGKGLLVASSDIFGEDLSKIILRFARINKDYPIYFKLHPNQFAEREIYGLIFSDLDNVKVITHEQSIYDLISICEAVFAIQSTAIYEALHLGRKGVIYKRNTYYRHKHIFDSPNVFLVDDENDLIEALKASLRPIGKEQIKFFCGFDRKKFNDLEL